MNLQVEASFLKEMGIFGNLTLTTPVLKQFVEGGVLTPAEQKSLKSIHWLAWNNYVTGKKSFSDVVHQVGSKYTPIVPDNPRAFDD